MAKYMKRTALSTLILTALFTGVYFFTKADILLSLAITAGTFAYHFGMRLLVGTAVNAILHNRADHTRRWFQPRPFEADLYRTLRVKRWKDRLPSYDPSLFSVTLRTPEAILGASCQAEVVHEIIIPLSFLPLLAAIPFGSFGVFFITSLLSALFDSLFVILQRYNRPRLLRYCRRQTQNAQNGI